MSTNSILWRGLYFVGHEHALLHQQNDAWHLEGVAVFSHEQQPCRLDYAIVCDNRWFTSSAHVWGWIGIQAVDIRIAVDAARRWQLNGVACEQVEGCTDIDLNFSPSTNLLPIRRLALDVGAGQAVRAAWLRFPGLYLEPLDQRYERIDQNHYRYISAGGQFVADLQVNAAGFVTDYPNLWVAE